MARISKPKLVNSILVEISGVPASWLERTCFIDGDQRHMFHEVTWGRHNGELAWYCQRCGQRLETLR